MKIKEFEKWCWNATWLIQYPPERQDVYDELYEHLQDHYEDLIAQGLSEEDAIKLALDSMGEAKEIAVPLAQLHSPFWGLLVHRLAIGLAILLCVTLVAFCIYVENLPFGNPSRRDFDVFSEASYGGDTGRTLLELSEPNVSFTGDGSTFTVTDAAIFTEVSQGKEMTRLYVQICQRTSLPWLEHDRCMPLVSPYLLEDFFVVDSLGNRYASFMEEGWDGVEFIQNGAQTGFFTYTHECWINDFQGVGGQWVDICYERDGRNFKLRIPLNGGSEG